MRIRLLAIGACVSTLCLARSADASAASSLARENVFALGGVGVAGTMSSGEKNLRSVLKATDAVPQLQSLLKKASPAGQLYALLGLRLRDRLAYDQAVPDFRKRSSMVSTMHGCNIGKEQMDSIVRQIDHGDFDAPLTRDPW